jgi:hypothetical protein
MMKGITAMNESPANSGSLAVTPKNPFKDWPLDKTYIGKAVPREGGGWNIRIVMADPEVEGHERLIGMTECVTLQQVEKKTWKFVRALTDEKDVHVISAPDIDNDIMERIIGAWIAMRDAKKAEADAAKRTREVVKELRERGLSVTDIAFLTHVSRGRVSQLLI